MLRTLTAAAVLAATPVMANARTVGPEAAPTDPNKDPRALYEAGERAYRLGRFQDALEKFEAAYDLSEQPLLLYNIALAYRQLYDVANDVEQLKRGRAVLKNFMLFADRDPDLDATDARKLLTDVETLIGAHKASEPPPPQNDPSKDASTPAPVKPVPTGEDPGRELKIAGLAVIGVGAAGAIASAITGTVYGVFGIQFRNELSRLREIDDGRCLGDTVSMECRQNDADIAQVRKNGQDSNKALGLSLGVGLGTGVLIVGAGLVPFLVGAKRTKRWEAGVWTAQELRVSPIVSRTMTGAGLSLRF